MGYGIPNLIDGMPVCGVCPSERGGCGGAMHFHYEMQNGLCRFCGPGSAKWTATQPAAMAPTYSGPSSMLPIGQAQAQSFANAAPMPAVTHVTPVPPTQPASLGVQGMAPQVMPAAPVPPVTSQGGIAVQMADPGIVATHLKAFGHGDCPYCHLATKGMNVDVRVVPHSPACPKAVPENGAAH